MTTSIASRQRSDLPPGVVGIGDLSIDLFGKDFPSLAISQIGTLDTSVPELKEPVTVTCHKCGKATFTIPRFMVPFTACEACCAEWEKNERNELCRKHWERICPVDLRTTDTKHPDFPAAIYKENRSYTGTESLFLFGPTRKGKTRVGMLLLKRALLAGKSVGIMWPEDLKSKAKSFNDRLRFLHEYAAYDVLLMDDCMLTGAQDEKIADFLKDLVDLMQRHGRHMIITSQIGGAEYMQQAEKWLRPGDKLSTADSDRIDALWSRIRERFRVVPFVQSTEPAPLF